MDTVFLVDDDAAVRKALARVLRNRGWRVELFDSAEAFLARADRQREGCMVLDVAMPGLDGLELQRLLAQEGPALPIVFLTGHGTVPMAVRAIKAGAADFLTKPVSAEALDGAVRSAIGRESAARQARAGAAELQQRFASLTPREREVLAALAAGRLNKQIAGDLGIVEQTVKFHRARIMEKLMARTAAEMMHIAARLGIGGAEQAAAARRPAASPGTPDSEEAAAPRD